MCSTRSKDELQIVLGRENHDYRRNLDHWDDTVIWSPYKEHNPHLLISGGSGSGKTEALKVICRELALNNVPILVFDYHNDFSSFAVNIVNEKNIKIHPLEILVGEKPKDVMYKVSSIFKHTFKDITTIQEGVIRNAIRQFYKECCIEDLTKPNDGSYRLLPFYRFRGFLNAATADKRTVASLEIKLDILFDYELFSESDATSLDFSTLLQQNTVFQLKNAPSDDVKKVVTELMISKLIQHCYLMEQTKKMRLYCIIDEAHRMAYSGSPIETLFREARKYGIGVILASQRATDFNENLLANAGTIITLKQNLSKDAKYIAKNEWARPDTLMRLRPGEGYIKASSELEAKMFQVVRHSDRSAQL